MEENLSSYLTGFEGFGRSFSRSVLAHDVNLHQRYKEALDNGSLPCNRLRILTIGDKGVGKTSTLQSLLGTACDPDVEAQATEGIEITICETSERRPSWDRCSNGVCTAADSPDLCAVWCVCAGIDSLQGLLKRENSNESTSSNQEALADKIRPTPMNKTPSDAFSVRKVVKRLSEMVIEMFYQVRLVAPTVLIFTFLSMFLDFSALCWLSLFLSVPSFDWDFDATYRLATPVTLQMVLIDAVLMVKMYIGGLEDTSGSLSSQCTLFVAMVFLYCVLCIIGTSFGIVCGLGGRNGLAIAFCLMQHQFLLYENLQIVAFQLAFNLVGVLLLRDGFTLIKKIALNVRLVGIILVVLGIANASGMDLFILIVDAILAMGMGFAFPYGVLVGREIVAKRKLMTSYIVKKSSGILIGVAVGYLINWKMIIFSEKSTWVSLVCSLLGVFGYLFYDIAVARKINDLERNGTPVTTFYRFLMDSANKDNPIAFKLHFWDNAGDSVYQTMQQFFRPSEAIYLLCFNLEVAQDDETVQIQRLRQWLFTLKAHSKENNTMVFVIGTHRSSVSEEFVESFRTKVESQLYIKDLCSILALNGEEPLYTVENTNVMDQDVLNLRESIMKVAKKTKFMKKLFPIRYLNILNKIHDMQTSGQLPWMMTTEDLLEVMQVDGMTLEELHEILAGLHKTGAVIYRNDDNILKDYVTLSPQHLLDVLKMIVRIPRKSNRSVTEAEDWLDLENKGVASRKLINTIVGSESLLPYVLRLMEVYNLLIPVYDPNSQILNSCIIPSHLPTFSGEDTSLWDPSDDDEEYFVDFGYVSPESIFHRLLAKCWDNRDGTERVFKTRGRFRHRGKWLYTMQLEPYSISQHTIKIIILNNKKNRCSLQILQLLHEYLEDIRRMDFPGLPYSCGPICPECSEVSGCRTVLKLSSDKKPFPTANMPSESFMENGKLHKVEFLPQLNVECGPRRQSSCSNSSVGYQTNPEGVQEQNHITITESATGNTVIGPVYNSTIDVRKN